MIAAPKIVLLILVAFALWYAVRWFNRAVPKAVRRGPATGAARTAGSAPSQAVVEDLVSCRACGAYVAESARRCGKAGCPLPA